MMDLSTAYRYNQNMMEYYTCKLAKIDELKVTLLEIEMILPLTIITSSSIKIIKRYKSF